MKPGYVYMMTNKSNNVVYTGVSSDLVKRVWQHKHGVTGGFTARYRVHKLVWFVCYEDIRDAISREKQIKAGSRSAKLRLIERMNPEWKDLYAEITGDSGAT